jgi:hypothetical protein
MVFYRYKKTVVVDATGDASIDLDPINGKIVSIQYNKASSGAYADGVDFVITNKRSGEVIWQEANVNASKIVYPQHTTNKPDGTTNAHGASVTGIYDYFVSANDIINIVVDEGGNATTGDFTIVYES